MADRLLSSHHLAGFGMAYWSGGALSLVFFRGILTDIRIASRGHKAFGVRRQIAVLGSIADY